MLNSALIVSFLVLQISATRPNNEARQAACKMARSFAGDDCKFFASSWGLTIVQLVEYVQRPIFRKISVLADYMPESNTSRRLFRI
jgi:hypothetical protein